VRILRRGGSRNLRWRGRLAATVGMTARMHFAELFDGHRRVNLGRIQFGMTEELLDVADVGPAFEHVGGAGVPEEVAGTGALHARAVERVTHNVAQAALAEAFAVAGQEQGLLGRVGFQSRPTVAEVTFQPVQGVLAHRSRSERF